MACSITQVKALLAKRRAQLEAAGESNERINIELAHLRARLTDSDSYNRRTAEARGLEPGLSPAEASQFKSLKAKVKEGLASGKTTLDGILGSEAGQFKFLLLKERAAGKSTKVTRATPKLQLMDKLDELIEKTKEAGQTSQSNRLKSLKKKIEQAAKTNSRRGIRHDTVRKLREELVTLKEDEASIAALAEEAVSGIDSELNKSLDKLKRLNKDKRTAGNKVTKANDAVADALDSKAGKNKIKGAKQNAKRAKQELDNIERDIAREQIRYQELLRKRSEKISKTPEGRALKKIKQDLAKIEKELSKLGINYNILVKAISENSPATARQIQEALERVNETISFKQSVFENMLKTPKVNTQELGELLGTTFVNKRASKKKTLSHEEAQKLFDEWKATVYQYAASEDAYIADMEFSDAESLEELAAIEENEGNLIDEASGDQPITRSMTSDEQARKSNPGVIPEKNKLKEGKQLYVALRRLLFKVETLRRMQTFGKFAPLDVMQTAMRDIAEIDDVSPAILFQDAISYDQGTVGNGNLSHDQLVSTARQALEELGIDPAVLNSLEFTEPVRWLNESKTFGVDIETHVDGTNAVHKIILMDEDNIDNLDTIITNNDQSNLSKEQVFEALQRIEAMQNAGMKLVTYNGNSFDLLNLAKIVGTEEAMRMAARITLRNIDLMQNIQSFGSRTTTSLDPLNRRFKLEKVARSLQIDVTGKEESFYPSLWSKVIQGKEITEADLVDVDLSPVDREAIVENINKLPKIEAQRLLNQYLLADGRLNIEVANKMIASTGSQVAIEHSSGVTYNVVLREVKPTWAMDLNRSEFYNGSSAALEGWSTTAEGQVMIALLENNLPTLNGGRVIFDLDKTQSILMNAMAIALSLDPNAKAYGKAIMEAAERAIAPEEKAALIAINIVKANQQAVRKLNEKAFEENGKNLPLAFVGMKETGGNVPKIQFAEGNESKQRQDYLDAIVDGMLRQMKEGRVSLESMVELVGFREQTTESDKKYLTALAKAAIEKYTDNKNVDLIDFGNGKIDFAPGHAVGRGIVQILNRDPQGFKKSRNVEEMRRNTRSEVNAEEIARGADPNKPTNLSQIFRLPTMSEVHNVFPRSLDQIERAYQDFAARQRIAHILGYNIKTEEEAQGIIDSYKDQKEDPDEVLADVSDILLDIIPNINNRRAFNQMPTLESHREMVVESLLDMPQLLVMWQHDSMTWARGMKLFLDDSVKNKRYAEDAFSPGSLTATALLSGLGPQFAHIKTFPILNEQMLFDSLERGKRAYKEGKYSTSNYFDFDMNGAHHFAALYLMYTDREQSTMDEILNNLELSDTARDRYMEAVNILRDMMPKIIEANQGNPSSLAEAEALKDFLETPDNRDSIKSSVLARLYMGGLPAVVDNIRTFLIKENLDVGFSPEFLGELLMGVKTYQQLNILDEALGQTEATRKRLANELNEALRPVYGTTGWHTKLKEIAQRNGFVTSGRRMFDLNQVEDAIDLRIKFIAQSLGKSEADVRKTFAKRIDKATKYMGEIGNKIRTDEQMRKLNVILMGSEEAYRTMPTLSAINALQRTPYKIRKNMVDKHADILGVHLEESDMLGFENFNVFFPIGDDASGRRLYMLHHKLQPQNSKLSNVIRENAGTDDNPYALWDFEQNLFQGLSREQQEAEITKLIAKHIALKLARNYAPKFGNYSRTKAEDRAVFMEEWQERSYKENLAYSRNLEMETNEAFFTEDERRLRSKNGVLVANSGRFLMNPDLSPDSAMNGRYNPGAANNLKGIGAFRPEYATIPWQERGIFGLMEMHYNIQNEQIRESRVKRPDREITDVNDVLPQNSRGYANPYEKSKAPYVYETAFDSTHDMIYGGTSRRIELRAAALKSELEKFAAQSGMLNLVTEGNWAKLYTAYKVNRAVITPFLNKMARLGQSEGIFSEGEFKQAQQIRLDMLSDLTSLWQFHDDVSHHSRSYLEFGDMIGVDGKSLQGKHYIDLLFMLAKNGVTNLKPMRLGLEPTGNLMATGERSAADQRETRTITLTVQGVDSLQVIFNLVYHEEGRRIANEYLKEVEKENFDSFEKDNNGFVLLSSVPLKHQSAILKRILDSDRFDATQEMDLYLFLDDFGSATIGNRVDYQNYQDKSAGKMAKPRPGGLPRMDTSMTDASAIYHLTPENINAMFTQLQNQIFLNQAELATMLGSEVGMATNPNIQFLNEERRKFYEMQRKAYADEMDVLAHLHQQSETSMKMTNNLRQVDEFGLPIAVYDAAHYVAGRDGGDSAVTLAYQSYLNQAINLAEIYGLKPEAAQLKEVLEFSQDDVRVIPAMLLLAQSGEINRGSGIRRLRAYFGNLTTEEAGKLFDQAKSDAQAYLSATTRTEVRNPYFNAAKRYVEINGPIDALNIAEPVFEYLGLTTDATPEDKRMARQAIERANANYEPGLLTTDLEVEAIGRTEEFIDAFGVNAAHLNIPIAEMVSNGIISEETAHLYRAMLGVIIAHNDSFTEGLSIQLDNSMDRVAKSFKHKDRFVIQLNPSLLKRRAVPEALEVMAHEISHIARIKYVKTEGHIYRGAVAAFQTTTGQRAMQDIVSTLFAGDQGEINALQEHYSTNIEEFMAEYGAFVLLSKVLDNKKLKSDIESLRRKHEEAEKAAGWWERAYSRLRHFTQNLASRMSVYRNENPETMKLLDDTAEAMFNFGNTYSKSRPSIEAESRSFTYPLRELEKGSALGDIGAVQETAFNLNRLESLEKRDDLTVDETEELGRLEADLSKYRFSGTRSRTILGQNADGYIKTIGNMITADGIRKPRNKEERVAVATFVLEQAAATRGRRGGEQAEGKKLLARFFDDESRATGVYQAIVDALYNGSARKVGEGSLGGGNTSSLTYASSESILAALGFLLDTTKGSGQNIYGGQVGGILANFNYIQQWTRTVVSASEVIRGKYGNKSKVVESLAYYWLASGEPASMDGMPDIMSRRDDITDQMFRDAVQYAKLYRQNAKNFDDMARHYGIRSNLQVTPRNMIGLKIQKDFFDRAEPGTVGAFVSGLQKIFQNKIETNLTPDGAADAVVLYFSEGLPLLVEKEDKSTLVNNISYYYQESKTFNEGQRLIKKEMENRAFKLWRKEKDLSGNLVNGSKPDSSFYRALQANPTSLSVHLYEAAESMLVDARYKGASYQTIFDSLDNTELQTVLEELRKQSSQNNLSGRGQREHHILSGAYEKVFPSMGQPTKLLEKTGVEYGITAANVNAQETIRRGGRNAVLPVDKASTLQVTDLHSDLSFLTEQERVAVDLGFSRDLRSIIVGLERSLGVTSYNRKAIKDITGVGEMTFASLIEAIKEAKADANWDVVLDKVKHKHDLAVGTATLMNEQDSSGTVVTGAKILSQGTDILWGPNQNAANLINEAVIGTVVQTLYGPGGLPTFLGDLTKSFGYLFANVFSRKLGRRLLQTQRFQAVEDALYDMDTATKGVLEHNLIDYDEKTPQEAEQEGLRKYGRAYIRRLKDGHRTASVALRQTLRLQGQRQLIKRLHRLDAYLDAIENYSGPKNKKMFADVVSEVGSSRVLDIAGTEAAIVQKMYESGLLTRENLAGVKYLVDKYGFNQKTRLINLAEIKQDLELLSDGGYGVGLYEQIPGAGGVTKSQVYEAMAAISRFQTKYAQETIVESNTLQTRTDNEPLHFIFNIYRSFPKLFVAQHVLESYGRTPPMVLGAKLLTATIMDIIYNLGLMWVAGILDDDALERITSGKATKEDLQFFVTALARNPLFSARLIPGLMSQIVASMGSEALLKDNPNYSRALMRTLEFGLLPPALLAGTGLVRRGSQTIENAISGEKDLDLSNAMDLGLRFVPGVGTITRNFITNLFGEDQRTNRSTSKPENFSPITASNFTLDQILPTDTNVFRPIFEPLMESGVQKYRQQLDEMRQFDTFNPLEIPKVSLPSPQTASEPVSEPSAPSRGTGMPEDDNRATEPAKAPDLE